MTHQSAFSTLSRGGIRRVMLAIALLVSFMGTTAHAAIPDTERQALVNLYTLTRGSAWSRSTNWNGPAGTECLWYGVTCNSTGDHVLKIDLVNNHLVGKLPMSLLRLSHLAVLNLSDNQLTGDIPDWSGFRNLRALNLSYNHLTGGIPALPVSLQSFDAKVNSLNGTISSFDGLQNLQRFVATQNSLSGSIPALTGLSRLQELRLDRNMLTGPIPSLSGLSQLRFLWVQQNQLSGPIPSLTGLTRLRSFWVWSNELSGTIPALDGLPSLVDFDVRLNQLTGGIPSLLGAPNLQNFEADNNQLSGTIPQLDSYTSLVRFQVSGNRLTGQAPSLAHTRIAAIWLGDNQLTGPPPDPPSPNTLTNYSSFLCPNNLDPIPSQIWDAATGETPWYKSCTPPQPGN